MTTTDSLIINGLEINPGTRTTINIPVARLYTHTDINMPVYVIRGKKAGPILFVSAAIHGDEILGVEIIRRLLKKKQLITIQGTLIAVPVVNVYGFINRTRYLPDRRDLNRFFPGSRTGSLASQLAAIFMEEIVSHATHGIDIHSGSNNRANLPQIRASLNSEETLRMASSFGAPIIINSEMRDGSLRQAVKDMNIPMLLFESGEALRFDENAIKAGIRGIISCMRSIGMIPALKPENIKPIEPLIAQSSLWVRANLSGVFNTSIKPGDVVSTNSKLGIISDPFGDTVETVYSKLSGVVIGKNMLPLVYKGDALFHIASLEEYETDNNSIETIYDFYDFDGDFFN